MASGQTNAVTGAQLPTLTNPAGAANIQSGYQAINADGEAITGTASVKEVATGTLRKSKNNQHYYWCYYSTPTSTESIRIMSTSPTTISALKGSTLTIVGDLGSLAESKTTGLEELYNSRIGSSTTNPEGQHVFVYGITGDTFSFSYSA